MVDKSFIIIVTVLMIISWHIVQPEYSEVLRNFKCMLISLLKLYGTYIFLVFIKKAYNNVPMDNLEKIGCNVVPIVSAICFCFRCWETSTQAAAEEFHMEVLPEILAIVLILIFCSKSQLENEERAKDLKGNLGKGLAKCNYQFLENAIKGKGVTPGQVEMLRRYKRDEAINEPWQWFCPRLLILFPEGSYPYQTNGKIWGTKEDLLARERNTSRSYCKSDDIRYEYTVSGGIQRVSTVEVVKVKRENKVFYAVVAENRPLTSLCKAVDYPIKNGRSGAEILVSKETYKIHFQVYMRELQTLLDNDPECRNKKDGSPLYEIVHYKESDSKNFSAVLLDVFKRIDKDLPIQGKSNVDLEIAVDSSSKVESKKEA